MTEQTGMTKAKLLAAIETGWNDLHAYLGTLSDEQMTIPADPAGWTVKDHLAHLAVWEDSLNALLEKTPRWEYMEVDRDLWDGVDWDKVNAVIQQRSHDMPLHEVNSLFSGVHARLLEKLKALSDADLQHPYKEYQPDSTQDTPIMHWMMIDTYQHYAEHTLWMDAIARQYATTVASLLAVTQTEWDDLNAYLSTLSDEQITQPTDPAGWTVKDHLAHLMAWEDGIWALLEKKPRREYMGIDEVVWKSADYDKINAIIQQRDQNISLSDLRQRFTSVHKRLVEKIKSLSDEDLQCPYHFYQPGSTADRPVIQWITGNTYEHYAEHIPWMDTIAKQG